jgi:uncharacterized phage protein (predicted DNA packaging)
VRKIINQALSEMKALFLCAKGGMGIVTLEEAKAFMKIEGDGEDNLIASFIATAQEYCENYIRQPISSFTSIPQSMHQAILILTAFFYENRESIKIEDISAVHGLLKPYRLEAW